jgi:hypothetical protein
MTRDEQTPGTQPEGSEPTPKKPYTAPQLVKYGEVRSLTQAGTTGSAEPSGMFPSKTSSRHIKQDIVRIGTHPLGFGLYLFHYRPDYRECYGSGRQFGVMADEVSAIAPEAVSTNALGHTVVDYGMLGIRPIL